MRRLGAAIALLCGLVVPAAAQVPLQTQLIPLPAGFACDGVMRHVLWRNPYSRALQIMRIDAGGEVTNNITALADVHVFVQRQSEYSRNTSDGIIYTQRFDLYAGEDRLVMAHVDALDLTPDFLNIPVGDGVHVRTYCVSRDGRPYTAAVKVLLSYVVP